jgi:tetratricopeptide (TPR) repeat protein
MSFSLYSQNAQNKDQAKGLLKTAIHEMDKGEIQKAKILLLKAQKLDSQNILYPYELAHCDFLTRHYKKAVTQLLPLVNHSGVTDHVYHLLGESYVHSGNKKSAEEIFKQGSEKFPKSGLIFLGQGELNLNEKKYTEALSYFENGIKADPSFPENYYWASKVHSSLDDKLWGVMYAELYINMEGVTSKSEELGAIIYDVFKNGIRFSGDSVIVELADEDPTGKNFENEFEKQLELSAEKINQPFSIGTLYKIREDFTNGWTNSANNEKFSNTLFNWHKLLISKGYFEPYHYWLLKKGNIEEFDQYMVKKSGLYNEFIDWISKNNLIPTESNFFVSSQFEED